MDKFEPFFHCTGSLGGPAYWSTSIGTRVAAEGMTDQPKCDNKQPTVISRSPELGLSFGAGGAWMGGYTGAWGASEGGSGSVERDRQNRDLYSNWTKCCENPANGSEQVQHNGWFLSTFCMTDNNTVLTSTTLHSTFLFWDFWFSLHCRALQRLFFLLYAWAVRQDAVVSSVTEKLNFARNASAEIVERLSSYLTRNWKLIKN